MKKHLILLTTLTFSVPAALAQSAFETNDVNDDGMLSKDEFYGLVTDAGIYPDVDLDSDGLIERHEWDELGLDEDFAEWDEDENEYLGADEFYDGYFFSFDDDEDRHWDGNEWDDAGDEGLFDV